jgi:threonylcarbamoyladenosine tRNA methylthiotransferase MtaB
VQSGSDSVLKRMGRKYTVSRIESLLKDLTDIPDFEWSSDIITGFPGETENEFSQTLEFLQKYQPVSVHVFPFSARKGTEAYSMKDKVRGDIIRSRAAYLRDIVSDIGVRVRSKYIGKVLQVLLEKESNGLYTGYSQNYIKTDIYKNKEAVLNTVADVKITADENGLRGELI